MQTVSQFFREFEDELIQESQIQDMDFERNKNQYSCQTHIFKGNVSYSLLHTLCLLAFVCWCVTHLSASSLNHKLYCYYLQAMETSQTLSAVSYHINIMIVFL